MTKLELAQKSCVPCHEGVPPLSDAEATRLTHELEGWKIVDDGGVKKLIKSYATKNFAEALRLANLVGEIAEAAGHHPDLLVRWGDLTITLWTHAIQGLSQNDFVMAAKIDCTERL